MRATIGRGTHQNGICRACQDRSIIINHFDGLYILEVSIAVIPDDMLESI